MIIKNYVAILNLMNANPPKSPKMITRCSWAGDDPLYVRYHDEEWGVPVRDDQRLFEFLVLETFQAGLSWMTILKKRENFRRAFTNFEPSRVAQFKAPDRKRLLDDVGIIRNRQKIDASINNAKCFEAIQKQEGSFTEYIWGFINGEPVLNEWVDENQVPASTPLAETLSQDLKSRGFKFVGPTIVYAHMQATGMVNDHIINCFRYTEIKNGE